MFLRQRYALVMLESARDIALNVLLRLREAGYEAYFAGGCVRDLLMGQSPKDYDVATNAAPNQVRALFKNTQAVGAAFGVILVRDGKHVIEVATFRTDLEYTDGRHPTGVKFATAEEDAQRRDFTINGLFFDPVDNRIIDHVGGQADLAARRLRAIGKADQRFAEDHLRMLRALRFASRLGFEIEAETTRAIVAHAHELIRISPERIAEELRKMLTPPTRDRAVQLLADLGFVRILMRFLPEKPAGGKDEAGPLFLAMSSTCSIAFGLALAAMVIDFRMQATAELNPRRWIAPAELKRAVNVMRQTLKISNDEAAEMTGAMSFAQLLGDAPPKVAQLKRFLNQPHSSDAVLLMTAIAKTAMVFNAAEKKGDGDLFFLVSRLSGVLAELDHWRATEFAPLPLISGDDLTAAGASPGPKFKLALDAVYDAQLEDRVSSKDQAMAMAMAILKG